MKLGPDRRKPIFDALRRLLGRGLKTADVTAMDAAIDAALTETGAQLAGEMGPPRKVSARGIALLHRFENCRLQAYLCPARVWTIGWGTTRINGKPVPPGLRITQDIADRLFAEDLASFEADVRHLIGTAPTTQGQFDALVSFAYNLGSDIDLDKIAEGLGDSTLLKKHLRGDYEGAGREFARWNKAKGEVLRGLVNRRAAEAELYLQSPS
jgi:lysozyme